MDHAFNWHRKKAPIQIHGLTTTEGFAAAVQLLPADVPFKFAHFGPPCGTFSRAREKPISKSLLVQGAPNPKPLRSEEFPDGFASLAGTDLAKVLAANQLNEVVAALVTGCHKQRDFWTIENPSRSLIWHTGSMKKLLALPGAYDVVLSACECGSKRSATSRRASGPTCPLKALHRSCSGKHPVRGHDGALRASWGVSKSEGSWKFATAEECEYTPELCSAMAEAAAQAISHARGADLTTFLATATSNASQRADRAKLRAQVGLQTRGRAMPKLTPEFRTQLTAVANQAAASRIVMRKPLSHDLQLDELVPAGAELVSIDSPTPRVIGGSSEGFSVLKFGIRWTPQEFLEQAKQVTHPFDAHDSVEDDIKMAIVHTLEMGIDQTRPRREEVLDFWESRAEGLQHDKNFLHKNMHPEIANVYKGKRFLLLREMLSSVSWPDVKLFDDLIAGMPIMGELPASGVFPTDQGRPEKSVGWLRSTARRTREAVRSDYFDDKDQELERFIREETLREVELGWAVGPLSDTELTETLHPLWILSRRFAVRQGRKLCVVDDYSRWIH